MVELPQGDVTEVRRGGAETLRLLSMDIARLGTTGYIRIERRPKEQMPRIGYVVFREGKPMLALHEADAITMSLEALLDIENDAGMVDALLGIHELPLPDLNQILNLHQEAHFQVDEHMETAEGSHQWWSKSKRRTSTWKRQERLPELEVMVEAPEAIRLRSKALMQRFGGIEKMLRPGDAYFFDSKNPAPLFDLAGHLAVHGRPLFVLARHDIEALNVEHNIPIASSSWLSQNGDVRSTEPTLENIRRKIDAFLWENLRAVIVLEGIEYLSSLHGDDRIVNFLRDIVDGVRLEDHLFIATGDFNAFPITTREHLSRYMTALEPSVLEHWNLEPDLILDHPLCAPPSEEEKQWIEQQLQLAISSSGAGNFSPQSTVFGTMEGGVESPDSEDILAATESLGTVVREWTEPEEKSYDQLPEEVERDASNRTPLPDTQVPVNVIEEVKDSMEGSELNMDTNLAKLSTHTPELIPTPIVKEMVDMNLPRKPQRMRRQRKSVPSRTIPRNQQGLQAAAANAYNAKEWVDLKASYTTPQSTFSNSLETYTDRQNKAVEKMRVKGAVKSDSTLNHATLQQTNHQKLGMHAAPLPKRSLDAIKGRQPINTPTRLTPLLTRPGVSSSAQPKEAIRESASRKQTESSIEKKLSIWEIEDRERLKKELEAAKK